MKKRTKTIDIPLTLCKDMKELTPNKSIESINFYKTNINDKEYLIDIIRTSNMNYYVRITDVTNGYDEIDFNEFKKKYGQPSLFDFWDI